MDLHLLPFCFWWRYTGGVGEGGGADCGRNYRKLANPEGVPCEGAFLLEL